MKYVATLLAILGLTAFTIPAQAYWTSDIATGKGRDTRYQYQHEHAGHYARTHRTRFAGHYGGGGMTCSTATAIGLGCGCHTAAHFGLPLDHNGVLNGMNLKRADEWLGFQHVAAAPGTAAVWPGRHVAPVVAVEANRVMVADAWATHWVSKRGLIFVAPGTATNRRYAAVSYRHRWRHRHYARA